MIAKKNSKDFDPCPEYTGRAVCVDVTPLKKIESSYGPREVFRFAFEVDMLREDGDGARWCVWSSGFTLSLSDKANLRKFLKGWLGRDLTKEELDGFDVETMLGKDAFIVVVHNESDDGKVYANIASCTPLKGQEPLKPSGKFVRAVDREKNGGNGGGGSSGGSGGGASYRRTSAPAESREQAAPDDADRYLLTKVHVGKFSGQELRDVSEEGLKKLADNWLPAAKQSPKPTADDKRLMAALEWWQREQTKSAVPVGADADF